MVSVGLMDEQLDDSVVVAAVAALLGAMNRNQIERIWYLLTGEKEL